MLASVKVPVLLTHHFRVVEETTGMLMGALSDCRRRARARADRGRRTDGRVPVVSQMGHAMHQQDPKLFAATLVEWVANGPPDAETLVHDSAFRSSSASPTR
jgi:hypothetical protein